ncbi:MAG: transcription-repair-coupling factor [Acidimicrobiales bacterium]|nr:MAG: transcription-repair-coupling factor [Acidimicrobiales bacterium]
MTSSLEATPESDEVVASARRSGHPAVCGEPPLRDVVEVIASSVAFHRVAGRRETTLVVPERGWAVVSAAASAAGEGLPVVVVTPTTSEAERLASDLAAFVTEGATELLPPWETLPLERVSPSVETMSRRQRVLWRLRHGDPALRVVVVPVRSLVQRLCPGVGALEPIRLARGGHVDPDGLGQALAAFGYRRVDQVEHHGEFARRGSVIDIFPGTDDAPVRIDLWDEEIESLANFSVADQRREAEIDEVVVWPARELLLDDEVRARAARLVEEEPWGAEQWERLAEGVYHDGMEAWLPWIGGDGETPLDLLGSDALVVVCDPRRVRDRVAELVSDEDELVSTLAPTWGARIGEEMPRLHVDVSVLESAGCKVWNLLPTAPDHATVALEMLPPAPPRPDFPSLARDLATLASDGWRVVVTADGPASASALRRSFSREGVDVPSREAGSEDDLSCPGLRLRVVALSSGFRLPERRLAVVTETDLTGRRRPHRPPRTRRRDSRRFFDDLRPGDYVVHDQHGVARFAGMVKRAMGGVERDYLLLEYRGGDRLYVPTEQIESVRPYTGGETPKLDRLGSGEWQKTKAKARAEAAAIAAELVDLYKKRATVQTKPVGPDTPWQREMEDAFPYQETPDQIQAIADVKADLESTRPMDRLVCGDVGFGKTEIAIRAAFKVVQDGGQVAVLVPTTLLAHQHTQTFRERLAPWPVRIEMLSRFLTPAQQRKVLRGVASGEVDIVIGTHRLLSDDVKFANLVLLVVDEEQRFGVEHKERLKKLRADVNVLTLTATPIPRTLEMSLVGVRDLSLLQTPPAGRQPILTYVGEFDERAVSEAIRRELLREGQVFYVHNRVQDIDRTAEFVRELVPEARVAVAHGQMDEGTLEQVVIDFWERKYDVLVCTTIIESGIDMPSVNTLVVDRAELLGLGQLHQLRGRVGRSGQRAYAYIFVPRDRRLPETVYERLRTIGEATELGAGLQIAMRDLELRGAGNLLGFAQSGHLAAVGYDLYCRLVAEAVAELRGEPLPETPEVTIDVPVDAHLPSDYVPSEELRIEAYRRLAAATSHEEVSDVEAEWRDRYGPLPEEAENLIAIGHLRAECVRVGIREVVVPRGDGPRRAILSPVALRESQKVRLARLFPRARHKPDSAELVLPLSPSADVVAQLQEAIEKLWSPGSAGGSAPGEGQSLAARGTTGAEVGEDR